MRASEAFDALTHEERLALLIELGFDDPMRYANWDEKDTRFGCLLYEVKVELSSCWVRERWTATPPADRRVKVIKKEEKRRTRSPMADEVARGLKSMKEKFDKIGG